MAQMLIWLKTIISTLFINKEIDTLYVIDSKSKDFDIISDYVLSVWNQNLD